ncbi:putative mRNA capping enzyme, beta chain [Elsinoe australis]|uniref:mRNA-capping enzyme subunit beta n=1 Tax=Elsinoe australis TaxID=40998 RepID=A0A4U7AWV1_9PEZI|nr:putative mRNA capping enzyme, beta chain [Elsinoe australis]
MDIRALMNKEPAAQNTQDERQAAPPYRPQSISRSASDNFGTPPLQQQQFQRPSVSGYPAQPPPLDTRASTFSNPGSVNPQYTPIRTPQAQTPGQHYPFPAQYQSPVQVHQRGPDRFPSLTPSGRSTSHSYGHPPDQRSPSSFAAPPLPLAASHSHPSATPPSANVHSPHGVRGSPGAAQGYQQIPYGSVQHQSQPNTPLGPPSAQRPQITTPREIVSPYAPHQRTFSGTSASGARSIASNSPGPPVSNINNIIESPAGYAPSLNHTKRRSTQDLQQAERDRSVSVSPKTQVSRRHPSTDSRHNSQDAWSARSSINHGRADAEYPPPSYAHPQASLSRSSTGHFSQGAPSPLSQAHPISQQQQVPLDTYNRPPVIETSHVAPPKRPSEEVPRQFSRGEGNVSLLQQPVSQSMMAGASPVKAHAEQQVEATTPLKRRAEELPEPEPKKPRTQYKEPPIWARLHPSNPKYHDQIRKYPQLKDMPQHDPRAPKRQQPPATLSRATSTNPPAPNRSTPQANGQAPSAAPSDSNRRKADVQSKLGMPWELSVTDTERGNPLTFAIATFLYQQMLMREDLGAGDPKNGSLEIEAKIGTLIDMNTNDRLQLPVQTTTVLKEDFTRSRLRFESRMNEVDYVPRAPILTTNFPIKAQNKNLNDRLNELLKASRGMIELPDLPKRGPHDPPRVPIDYKHRYERDTFASLSPYCISQLPPSAANELRRQGKRPETLRLRTTYDNDQKTLKGAKPPVIAQIIKIRLADLDIYCPNDPFDIRISVNIEMDFHGRTDVDHAALPDVPVDPDAGAATQRGKGPSPDRYKNRLSYKHLLYSIDLTQVTGDAAGQGHKTHELEIEVDAETLRYQAELLKTGRENCYEAVVEGFINNFLLLARYKKGSEGLM